jgi:DNA-binding transcriptional MerR regulator
MERRCPVVNIDSVIAAFTSDQVSNLTGLSITQLRYWDEIGFFKPQHVAENTRTPYSRIYSFKDIVGLRVISILKNAYKVTMPNLKAAATKLEKHSSHPWSDMKLSVWKNQVTWINPETQKHEAVADGQGVVFDLISVVEDMRNKVELLKVRSTDEVGKSQRNRYIAHNAEVFAGTRIPIDTVRRFYNAGYNVDTILQEFPTLERGDVEYALADVIAA